MRRAAGRRAGGAGRLTPPDCKLSSTGPRGGVCRRNRLGFVRRAALVPVLALAVVGCSASGEEQSPGSVPSLSPVATPTASVPPLPAAAQGDGPEAASEFAKYYLGLVTRAFATGDSATLRSLSDAGCEGCQALAAAVDELAAQGRRAEGGEYTFTSAVAPGSEKQDYIVLIDYSRAVTRIRDSQGAVVAEEPAVSGRTSQMRVVREGERWVVYGYQVLPQ